MDFNKGKYDLIIDSPGRINIIGEHTDYNDGFVFPAAVDKGIAAAIQKSDSKVSSAYALDKDSCIEFELNHLNFYLLHWQSMPF